MELIVQPLPYCRPLLVPHESSACYPPLQVVCRALRDASPVSSRLRILPARRQLASMNHRTVTVHPRYLIALLVAMPCRITGATTATNCCDEPNCRKRHPKHCKTGGTLTRVEHSGGKFGGTLRRQLYDSCRALDVGPQPISQLELEQGAKLVRDGLRWIKSFDREAVEATYYKRFASDQQRVPGLRLAGEPVLCLGARLGGEVRALTRLGALAIGIDFNPGFRNPHVLWGDALSLQFADATFKVAYTNVLDHIDAAGIGVVARHVYRVLKPGGILLVDIDAHKPDKYAQSSFETVVAAVEQSLALSGMTITSRRPFCKSSAEWSHGFGGNSTCVLGNPTVDAGIDPAGGVSLVARRT